MEPISLKFKNSYKKRKENSKLLASGYTYKKRLGEILSIFIFIITFSIIAWNLRELYKIQYIWIIISSGFLSLLVADFFSGLIHWAADTWGNLKTPLVGQTFIRSFREHHVDPIQITKHDIIETNGDNCLLTLPFLIPLSFIQINKNLFILFQISFLLQLCVWLSLTNQIHKWAHMIKPPKIIQILQDFYIILPRKNHQIHHHNPFDQFYCITTGWLNPILSYINFWKKLEKIITKLTGAIPRQDDAYWTVS